MIFVNRFLYVFFPRRGNEGRALAICEKHNLKENLIRKFNKSHINLYSPVLRN